MDYKETVSALLPLICHCEGVGTQETGIIRWIIQRLSIKDKFCVEFGQRTLGGGTLSDIIRETQWSLLNMDQKAITDLEVRKPFGAYTTWTLSKECIHPMNLNTLLDHHSVPKAPAVVVIDMDGMDYWCTMALLHRRRPQLLIVEYNCHVPADCSASLALNDHHIYTKDTNYGASLKAFRDLCEAHEYMLVHVHGPLNLYFVDSSCIADAAGNEIKSLPIIDQAKLDLIADTKLFYDTFHPGQRPSWFGTPKPDINKSPWIELSDDNCEIQMIGGVGI